MGLITGYRLYLIILVTLHGYPRGAGGRKSLNALELAKTRCDLGSGFCGGTCPL